MGIQEKRVWTVVAAPTAAGMISALGDVPEGARLTNAYVDSEVSTYFDGTVLHDASKAVLEFEMGA